MKKLFALFCAVCLMPTFSAQAWIGGPFSNNTFFGETGSDGIYEASATALNGLGLYRITVGNNYTGVNSTGVQISGNPVSADASAGRAIDYSGVILSGNAVIGGFASSFSNIWYFEGVVYRGRAMGSVNGVSGRVDCVGDTYSTLVVQPQDLTDLTPPGPPQDLTPIAQLSSSFVAQLTSSGKLIAGRTFQGRGRGQILFANNTKSRAFRFSVFGSKVSDQILLGL